MAKAIYTTSSGLRVTLEGSTDEVAELVKKLAAETGGGPGHDHVGKKGDKATARRGVAGYVLALRESGYFRTPRKLGEVAEALSKDGHTVPVTVLAVALLRLVRSKELQRVKEGGGWKYGNR